jgi:hypothetical protein
MEKVTPRRRIVLAAALLFFTFSLQAQRPSLRYQQTIEAGRIEPRIRSFVEACLHTETLPRPIQLYSQGDWFVTPDLASHIRQQGSDDDGTAQVWQLDGRPRAVSMWVHDDEFDRSTLACLDDNGTVSRQVNEYMPGMSEPDLHWIYIHSFTLLTPSAKYRSDGHYTDWNRKPIHAPRLTSEDKDFIAGERQYRKWSDFDFADRVEHTSP